MDPEAAWQSLCDFLQAGDWLSAEAAAQDLQDWLGNGGFPPQVLKQFLGHVELQRSVALAVCQFVLRRKAN